MNTYKDLQDSIDRVVGTIGLKNTIHLLGCFIRHLEPETEKPSRQQAIRSFITRRAVREFDLSLENLQESDLNEYSEARAVCYFLLHKYCGLSYRLIGEYFGGRKDYHVKYFIGKCDELRSLPRVNRLFCHKLDSVETDTLTFISNLT